MKKLLSLIVAVLLLLCSVLPAFAEKSETDWETVEYVYSLLCEENREALEELFPRDGCYDDVISVGVYLYCYEELPENYMTKKEARRHGWFSGALSRVLPGYAIGGDWFGNYAGILPKKKGITYTECDLDTIGEKSRGSKRIVFDNKGRIYYTEDHYETFTLLYEPGMNEEVLKNAS